MPEPMRIVAAIIRDAAGRVLLVRKRGTSVFMQPGGKPEPGESNSEALAREIEEELGCRIVPPSLRYVGDAEAAAAHEPGQCVRASVYEVEVAGEIVAGGEIAEARWVDPRASDVPLAALTGEEIFAMPIFSR